jgi:predicted GNAT family acetyltransferase
MRCSPASGPTDLPYHPRMDVIRPESPTAFLELASPLLSASEARHNLMLGIAGTLVSQPDVYPVHRLWVVTDAGRPVAAALRTPPHHLVLADPIDQAALEPLLESALETEGDVEGIVANGPFAQAAASIWTSLTGTVITLEFAQGVFELTQVADVARPEGAAREGTPERDRDLAIEWMAAFSSEALWHRPLDADNVPHAVDARLGRESAGLWFWDDGDATVSMCGYGGPTPTGIRIGPVFTPRELRGHGYATALVADVSHEMLARGYRACFLYTDLSNPTSNAIYERIGYRRVADAFEIQFGEPSP